MESRAVETPIGTLGLVGSDAGLRYVRWSTSGLDLDSGCAVLDDAAAQLQGYFAGDLIAFDLPLDLGGTEFQRRCWLALATIPYGQTVTYGEQARRLELGPDSARAVARGERPEPTPPRAALPPCDRGRRIVDGLRRRARAEALPPRARGRAASPVALGRERCGPVAQDDEAIALEGDERLAVGRVLARCDGAQRDRPPLPEGALEPRLLAQRLVPSPPRRAGGRERAVAATRDAGDADRCPEIEERLRTGAVEARPGALLNPPDVRVDRQHVAPEGEIADGGGGVRTDAGELGEVVRPAVNGHLPGGTVQIDGAAVVAEPLPLDDHVRRGRARERLDARPALEPGLPARDHAVDLRLLQHDLRDEDRIGIVRPPPGQIAPVLLVPGQEQLPHRPEPRGRRRPGGNRYSYFIR